MNLLGVELARLAPLDHLSRVRERRRPIEAAVICFPDEGDSRGMMPTFAGVDVPEEFLALVSQDALQSDTTRATPVQVTILDAVSRGLAHYSFSLRLLLGKLAADEEGLELEDPIHSLLPCQCQENAVAQRQPVVRSPLLRWRWQSRRKLRSR
jgi:hypothetical protein